MFNFGKKYKVKINGRAGLKYSEGKKETLVDSEMLSGPKHDVVIYSDSIVSWEAPYSDETINNDQRMLILERIKSDLENNGYKVDIQ